MKKPPETNKRKMLSEEIGKMVEGIKFNRKKIFREKPHNTWNDYFSVNVIFDLIGRDGFTWTITCMGDCFRKEILKQYLWVKKTDTLRCTKVARFQEPIVAVKTSNYSPESDENFKKSALILFQSITSYNIAKFNALDGCKYSSRANEKGRDNGNKRHWII